MAKLNIKRKRYYYFFDFRLLERNYCPICGNEYKRKYLRYHVFTEYKKFTTSVSYGGVYYHCSKCDFYIKYDKQKFITKMQNETNNLILDRAKDKINVMKVKVKKVGDLYILEEN